MQELENIVAALKNTVRFNQSQKPGIPKLESYLTDPATARLVYHPLLINENLDAVAPDFDNWDFPIWDSGTTYNSGDRVRASDDQVYESVGGSNLNNDPVTTTGFWDLVPLLSEWIENIREESVRNVVTSVFNFKKNDRQTKEMIDHLLLYNGAGRINDRIIKSNRMVGFEIRLLDNVNIRTIIETLALQFTEADTIPFYLYHSSQVDPLDIWPVTTAKAGSVEYFDVGDNLRNLLYEDFTTGQEVTAGFYYLVYFEEDLLPNNQAVNYRYTFGRAPCKGCGSNGNYALYQKWSQYFDIRTISLQESQIPAGRVMWDLNTHRYDLDTNFGMNLRLSALCDLSDYVIRHPEMFADSIARQITVDLLTELANSTANNQIQSFVQERARFALQDTSLGGEGELDQLNKAKDALNFELSDIQSSVCMPEQASKGMEWMSVSTRGNQQLTNGYGGKF